ncbi:MAG: hypothetical protein K2X11_02560 [Acetobacteraceae bacterium]|nr:hypothetical protein [Acetobacteraceae bacterium]
MAGRRAALLALPGLAAAPAAASAETDAELLAFLPRIRAARALSDAAAMAEDAIPLADVAGLQAQQAKTRAVMAEEDAQLERFARIPASTILGIVAKAGVLARFGGLNDAWEGPLADAILADVRRLVPAFAPSLSPPSDEAAMGGV